MPTQPYAPTPVAKASSARGEGRGGRPQRVDREDGRAHRAGEGEPHRPPAGEPAIAGRAQREARDRAARLRGGHQEAGADLVEAEGLDGEERQVAQHRGLHHPEHEAGGEEDDERGSPRPPPARRRRRPRLARGRPDAARPRRRADASRARPAGPPPPSRRRPRSATRARPRSRARARAETRPPRVRPICLTPIAMPRSRTGKTSMMALPSVGFTTLQPAPATKRQARKAGKPGASAAARRPAAPSASPPRKRGAPRAGPRAGRRAARRAGRRDRSRAR